MNLVYKCNECNSTYPSKKGLCIHIAQTHNTKDYYDKYLKHPNEGYCTVCGNPTKFRKLSAGYDKTCSSACYKKLDRTNYRHSDTPLLVQWQRDIEDIQATYSREQLVQYQCKLCNTPVIIKIRKITGLVCIKCKRRWGNLRSFGDENPFQNTQIKQKIEATVLKKYGVKHVLQNPDIHRKMQEKKFHAPNGRLYDSSWEYLFELYLIQHKIDYIYQSDITFTWTDVDGDTRLYIPDFHILRSDRMNFLSNDIIEIKGDHFFDQNGHFRDPYDLSAKGYENAKRKYECMVSHGVKILTSKDLIKLGIKVTGV